MGRKGRQAKQAEIFAPDGRKILGAKEWNEAVRKRIRERALAIIKEHDDQAAARSLGTLQITIGKLTVKASKDYHGTVTKVLEFAAVVPFSQRVENILSANLQEPLSCELKPKQIGMNLKTGWDKQPQIPEEFEEEAAAAVAEDHDVKAALEDLCTCGHTRNEHLEEDWNGKETVPNLERLAGCEVQDCECRLFIPLAPGEKSTPMTGSEAGEGDDKE